MADGAIALFRSPSYALSCLPRQRGVQGKKSGIVMTKDASRPLPDPCPPPTAAQI